MSQSTHLSAERIADLLAGRLPAVEAMTANGHLAGCAGCGEIRESLLAVVALLADEGARSWEMPPDVAAAIDTALTEASNERAAGVPALGSQDVRPARSRRPLTWLAGAAAAVVFAAAGVAGLKALPQSSGDASSTAGADYSRGPAAKAPAGGSAGEGKSETDSKLQVPGTAQPPLPPVTAAEVPSAARRLAARVPPFATDQVTHCAEPLTGDRSTVVLFAGRPAVLTITRATRTATVFDCATATRSLLVTGY